ncbi:hypothetical protein Tco_0773403 [Tanacetum coccineum]|uniref:Reverse transcriptase domain-containing protein n=1 Tax=Tanacetum coccineum TaxID=301880 RepID=A0ABQ4ZLN7_9ASTR
MPRNNGKDRPDQAKVASGQSDKPRATLIVKRNRWSSKLETELCSRSSPWKGCVGRSRFVKKPDKIMGTEIKRLKRSRIPLVKVRWNSRRGPEFTWEREDSFKQKYPQLFTTRVSHPLRRSLSFETKLF